MPTRQDLASFIGSSFRSVWALELLILLRSNDERSWTDAQMVDALRGSNLVVQQSVQALLAAGLVVIHTDGLVRYQPASEAIGELAGAVETLYAERPNAVRRMIVSPPPSSIASFANAFKLRSDQ